MIEGRSPEGGSATIVVAPPSDDDRSTGRPVLLFAPGPALLTRRQVVDLVAVLQGLLEVDR